MKKWLRIVFWKRMANIQAATNIVKARQRGPTILLTS